MVHFDAKWYLVTWKRKHFYILRRKHCALWRRKLEIEKSYEEVLQSFEKWVLRRVLRINWTERKTNKWVQERIAVKEDGIVKQIKGESWQKICTRTGDRKV